MWKERKHQGYRLRPALEVKLDAIFEIHDQKIEELKKYISSLKNIYLWLLSIWWVATDKTR